jgi:hypothetical protein
MSEILLFVLRRQDYRHVRILRISEVGLEALLFSIHGPKNLIINPHVHCIVTGGGVSPDGRHWFTGNLKYLVPVKKLSHVNAVKE